MKIQKKIAYIYTGVIFLVLLTTLGVSFRIGVLNVEKTMDDNLKNAASILAKTPIVIRTLQEKRPSKELNEYLDGALKEMENLDIIVLCDMNSIRYYHPTKSRIGETIVGGDEGPMIQGSPGYFSTETGTLGLQRRYFCPVTDGNGRRIGFVLTSVLLKKITHVRHRLMTAYLTIGLGVLLLIVLVYAEMSSYMQKLLLGYEPEQLARLYIQRQDVINALDEGVIAINSEREVIIANQSASRLLGLPQGRLEGLRIEKVFPHSRLGDVLKTRQPEYNLTEQYADVSLLTSYIPIEEKGTLIGAVSILRKRTDVTKMAEELTGVNHMVDAMRAYTHEFTNKLHIILGLLQLGETKKASDYILDVAVPQREKISMIVDAIANPTIAALLIGKLNRAIELGIQFSLNANSQVKNGRLLIPSGDLVTILGNLLENAIDELNNKEMPPKEIYVSMFCDEQCIVMTVDDTGNGMTKEICKQIFEKGFSTKKTGRGTGLYLVKSLVDSCQGQIRVETEPGAGTSITVAIGGRIAVEGRLKKC